MASRSIASDRTSAGLEPGDLAAPTVRGRSPLLQPEARLPRIIVFGNKFVDPTGQEFKLWGLDATGSEISGDQIDDNMDQRWKIDQIRQDFGEMSSLKANDMQANVVRLHPRSTSS